MKIKSINNFKITEALSNYVTKKTKKLQKISFVKEEEVTIYLGFNNRKGIFKIRYRSPKGAMLYASFSNEDLYKAIDLGTDNFLRMLKKEKESFTKKKGQSVTRQVILEVEDE